jgi:hypothetical protein
VFMGFIAWGMCLYAELAREPELTGACVEPMPGAPAAS